MIEHSNNDRKAMNVIRSHLIVTGVEKCQQSAKSRTTNTVGKYLLIPTLSISLSTLMRSTLIPKLSETLSRQTQQISLEYQEVDLLKNVFHISQSIPSSKANNMSCKASVTTTFPTSLGVTSLAVMIQTYMLFTAHQCFCFSNLGEISKQILNRLQNHGSRPSQHSSLPLLDIFTTSSLAYNIFMSASHRLSVIPVTR